jgi:MoaA/NifB/PqqE/SkfB family radical SAM enzyme
MGMPVGKMLEDVELYYDALVPAIYSPNRLPEGFILKHWSLDNETIQRSMINARIDGAETKIRPISTIDLEFLSNDIVRRAKRGEVDLVRNYPCGLKCPGCFSEESIYGDIKNLMPWQEVMGVVDDAEQIGLKAAKFLGPGELFQNPDLFDILDAFKQRDIVFSIFTKGAELGSDKLARQIYGESGIDSARDLVKRIAEYDNIRILLGFNSFFPERQDKIVGSLRTTADYQVVDGTFDRRGVVNYTEKRNRALVNLVDAGFNDPRGEQRVTLIAAPAGLDQIDELPSMYKWAALRNMPIIIAPTMESGPKSIGLTNFNQRIDPVHLKLIEMMEAIYTTAIENGILSLEQVKKEGVSAYIGTKPCDQVANGLFVRLNGRVQMCPGRSDSSATYGNIHQEPLAKIWVNSPNYRLGAISNNWCTAKTSGMPTVVQEEVMSRLLRKPMVERARSTA